MVNLADNFDENVKDINFDLAKYLNNFLNGFKFIEETFLTG